MRCRNDSIDTSWARRTPRTILAHFLISVIGNYEIQEPTQAQLDAIADMMAWALDQFDLPLDRLGGHYNYADTGCPGKNLRKYLEDGTFKRMVAQRLHRTN